MYDFPIEVHKLSLGNFYLDSFYHFISEGYFLWSRSLKCSILVASFRKSQQKCFRQKNNPRTNKNERYFYNLFWPACCAIRSLGDVWLSEIVEWWTSGYQILGTLRRAIQILGNPYCELVKRWLIGEATTAHKQIQIWNTNTSTITNIFIRYWSQSNHIVSWSSGGW